MKLLTAGPWVGEFGYELFGWQASLRALAKDFDRVIVSSRPGHEILYADFCDEFIPYMTDVHSCSGTSNYLPTSRNPFAAIRATSHISGKKLGEPREFIQFGTPHKSLQFDIVIHARAIQAIPEAGHEKKMRKKASRNWSLEKWNSLVERLKSVPLKICCIGAKDAAYHLEGTESLLGVPMDRLVNVFASSELAIGPSSGPMHLASLCGCPHFVWTVKKSIKRFKTLWNPLNTPTSVFVDQEWDPDVDRVFDGVMKMYNEL